MAGRILVLDDEENYAEMLQDLLLEHSYRVDMATRPERAIAQLEEIPYDLIISDYKMPVMDGADFLKKARELYPNLPFILVSGLMNTPELVKVANMGVTLVMEKPLDTQNFLRHVARFSEPMTAEEKLKFAQEDTQSSGSGEISYPDEPRFFSANHRYSSGFMQKLWAIAKESNEVLISETDFGEALLAARDLSVWRGNNDMIVQMIDLPVWNSEMIDELKEILADQEKSPVVVIKLSSSQQIEQAKKLTESVLSEIEGSDQLLLVYVIQEAEQTKPDLKYENLSVRIPELSSRPSDVAAYASRFARIASERTAKTRCAGFEASAVYSILSCKWVKGYTQLQQIIFAAVESGEDAPLTAQALGQSVEVVAAENRLSSLMKIAQSRIVIEQMTQNNLSPGELASSLELDGSIQTTEDLMRMPLISADLVTL